MTNVQHPKFRNLGTKQVAATMPPPQVHNVMPPEDEAFMRQMSSVMEALPVSGPPQPIIDDAIVQKEMQKKHILEKIVLFKTPHVTEVEIAGSVFRLKLLNTQDNATVFSMIKELPPDDQITKTPIVLLAASLVDIDGMKLEDVYSGPLEITEPIKQKYYELCSWNMPIINALAVAYRSFNDKTEKEFSSNFLDKQ